MTKIYCIITGDLSNRDKYKYKCDIRVWIKPKEANHLLIFRLLLIGIEMTVDVEDQ